MNDGRSDEILKAYGRQGLDAGRFPSKVPSLNTLIRGSSSVELDSRLGYQDGETLVEKKYASAFFGTALAAELTALRIDTHLVCVATTSGSIRATVVDALQHGFRPFVPEECVGDRSAEPHRSNLLDIQAKYGEVIPLQKAIDSLAVTEAQPSGNQK